MEGESVPYVVRRFVEGIIAKVLSAEHAGHAAQQTPLGTPLQEQAAVSEPEQALAPSPASALANALAELALQTPLPKRLPYEPNGTPAAAVGAAGAALPPAEAVAGEPGVLVVAPPAAARSEDLSVGLCYDKLMEQHMGPPGAAAALIPILQILVMCMQRYLCCASKLSLWLVADHVERPLRTARLVKVLIAAGLASRCSTICPRQVMLCFVLRLLRASHPLRYLRIATTFSL